MSEYVKYQKDPDSLLDYTVNWSAFLGTDIIVGSIWEVPVDLTVESENFADDSATIWLSGGLLGNVYKITNRITTDNGRVDDRSFHLQIEEQ